jgi:hypothetical protein
LHGICTASTPPRVSFPTRRGSNRRWSSSQCIVALENNRSAGICGDHWAMSACRSLTSGASWPALASISEEESTPVMAAPGQRDASRRVMLPGRNRGRRRCADYQVGSVPAGRAPGAGDDQRISGIQLDPKSAFRSHLHRTSLTAFACRAARPRR